MLASLTLLVLATAQAGDPCGTPTCMVAADALAVLQIEPSKSSPPPAQQAPAGLPSGTLSLADLEGIYEALAQDGATVNDLFALLADGEQRVLPGDVVREALAKYGVDMPLLPIANLVSIESNGFQLTVNLDFGRNSYKKIKLPTSNNLVVAYTNTRDPFNIESTRLETKKGGGHTLVVQDTITLGISEDGLTSIAGVGVKKFFTFSVDGHSETVPGKVATEDDEVLVQVDSNGEPVVQDGHYVPQVYDDWIILKVVGRRIEIGVPAFEPTSPN